MLWYSIRKVKKKIQTDREKLNMSFNKCEDPTCFCHSEKEYSVFSSWKDGYISVFIYSTMCIMSSVSIRHFKMLTVNLVVSFSILAWMLNVNQHRANLSLFLYTESCAWVAALTWFWFWKQKTVKKKQNLWLDIMLAVFIFQRLLAFLFLPWLHLNV